MTACGICQYFSTAGDFFKDVPMCLMCWNELYTDEELVDDLAREIYVKEWLVPSKKKKLK